MPRELSWIPTLVLLAALTSPSAALTVIVPDDHPTIQAAMDAGADVIQVRGGLVPERLTLQREVTIEPGPAPPYLWSWAPMPMVQSLEVHPESEGQFSPGFTVRGVRFLGEVRLRATQGYLFESCRFDSGLTDTMSSNVAGHYVSIRNCMIVGGVRAPGAVQFVGNTVIGGTANISSDGSHDISHNYITGSASAGLELGLYDSGGPVSRNTIRNVGDGILLRVSNWETRVQHNDISSCRGDGIVYLPESEGTYVRATCDSNLIQDCAGAGIAMRGASEEFRRFAHLSGNTIRGTGQDGVHLEATFAYPVRGNTIFDAGGDGFSVEHVAQFEGNVIGRCGGAGLRVLEATESIVGNTFFLNGGAGMDLGGIYEGSEITHNLCAFNFGPGMRVDGEPHLGYGTPDFSCNNWFANAGGAVVGAEVDSTNLSVHPLFCDLNAGDVHLSASSPLLAAGNCGLIGALGQGCGGIASVEHAPTGVDAGFRAWPVPSRGAVAFSLPASTEPTEIEVFDVTGARRWQSAIPGGVAAAHWDRREGSGGTAPPGVYVARLSRAGAEVARARVVITE
jgi:parallel beta-helix repeat protein